MFSPQTNIECSLLIDMLHFRFKVDCQIVNSLSVKVDHTYDSHTLTLRCAENSPSKTKSRHEALSDDAKVFGSETAHQITIHIGTSHKLCAFFFLSLFNLVRPTWSWKMANCNSRSSHFDFIDCICFYLLEYCRFTGQTATMLPNINWNCHWAESLLNYSFRNFSTAFIFQ